MSARLRREASLWLIRLQADEVSAETRAQFDAWLHARKEHAEAFELVSAAVEDAAAALRASPAEVVRFRPRAPPVSRRALTLGMATAAAVSLGVTGIIWSNHKEITVYETALGQQRQIEMGEGSRLELNTDTSVTVEIGSRLRALALTRGEALFEVAHDPNRPFEVEADGVRVRAIGTVFAVRRDSDAVEIMVTEGLVRAARGDAHYLVAAGERLRIGRRDVERFRFDAADAARALAWREGMLRFDGDPLEEVVDAVSRHTGARFVIANEDLKRQGVVAYIRADNLEGFVGAIERNFPDVEVVRTDETYIIRRKSAQL